MVNSNSRPNRSRRNGSRQNGNIPVLTDSGLTIIAYQFDVISLPDYTGMH